MLRMFTDALRRHVRLWLLPSMAAVAVLAGFVTAGQAQVTAGPGGVKKVSVHAVWLNSETRPGGQNVLAVVFDVIEGWHIASDEAQAVEAGFVPSFTTVKVVTDDPRLTFGQAQFPKPDMMRLGVLPDPFAVFDGQVVVYLPAVVAEDAGPGPIDIQVAVKYQACDDKTCDFPKKEKTSAALTIIPADAQGTKTPGPDPLFSGFDPAVFGTMGMDVTPGASFLAGGAPQTSGWEVDFYLFKLSPTHPATFALFLLLAAVGGALLNFTPCVLPVIPIKVLGLAQTAGNRRRTLALGTVMALGVVTFWLALGVAIAGISGFTAANQLFQYPAFSISVGVVIAVMAVGMCGLFAVRLPNFVYALNPRHDSYLGSFGFGIMTAVLSTPCTAPFMGSAAAWAATRRPGVTLATFAAIGVGMALPYFILSANPRLVERLPRTGPGSELLKQVMGLLMLAAAVFFIGAGVSGMLGDGTQAAPKGHWWVVGAFVAAAGVWLIVRVFPVTPSPAKRGAFVTLGLVTIAAAAVGASELSRSTQGEDAPIDWVYYTPQRFEQALADGNAVLLDFTADWCANCHLLELTVLNTDDVSGMLRGEGYVAMKVDLTGGYPDGKKMLSDTGAVMIPWLVVYAPDGREVFKADWYTVGQVTDALTRARQNTAVSERSQSNPSATPIAPGGNRAFNRGPAPTASP
jgi:suppressor for copper-sensitivity B